MKPSMAEFGRHRGICELRGPAIKVNVGFIQLRCHGEISHDKERLYSGKQQPDRAGMDGINNY
jgi:hypothetical protein